MTAEEKILLATVFLVLFFVIFIYGVGSDVPATTEPTIIETQATEIATVPTEPTTVSTEPPTIPTEPLTEPPTEPAPPFTEPGTAPIEYGEGYIAYFVPEKYNKKDFKSYEIHTSITSKSSPHYKLQQNHAYTAPNGIRAVNERYCIALGSYFTTRIGQYVDVILANGTIIECILGDQKADRHTDDLHIAHRKDDSIVEFIVDKNVLDRDILYNYGNMSYLYDEWKSPVVKVVVYDINYFEIVD